MKNALLVQQFIKDHIAWETLLSDKPYCIAISREKWNGLNLLMLKYNQVESDFNNPLVRECRGLILNEDTLEPVSVPFFKFGNVSEGTWVDDINWNDHPYVLEKCDGSLVKVVKIGGKLLVSTNGTILASTAPLGDWIGCTMKSFEELFFWALDQQFNGYGYDDLFNALEEGYTYMFELCTNYNKVVVPHPEPKVYFIGVRNNTTLAETYIMDHPLSKVFPTPKVYEFKTFQDCIEHAKSLPWNEEGYVITSKDFKRNKAKSVLYLSAHHLKNNGSLSYSRALELVRANEIDEVTAYFPEYKDALEECKAKFWKLVEDTKNAWESYKKIDASLPTRKDKALWITKNFSFPGIAFGMLDGKITSIEDFFMNAPTEKLLRSLGYKE